MQSYSMNNGFSRSLQAQDGELVNRLKLQALNKALPANWEARSDQQRVYYLNHETRIVTWLPPESAWLDSYSLPYGYECALDATNREYFINHVERTTSYDNVRSEFFKHIGRQRTVRLVRDPQLGYGFTATGDSPVVIKNVAIHGPSDELLLINDEITAVNDEPVQTSTLEAVVRLIRSCPLMLTLTVRQPARPVTLKKSAFLTASKKARLRNNLTHRVRFAAAVNSAESPVERTCAEKMLDNFPCSHQADVASHFCSTSNCQLQDDLVNDSRDGQLSALVPDFVRVFLENGQTRTIRCEQLTTVNDLLLPILIRLQIKAIDHFSLVLLPAEWTSIGDVIVLKADQRMMDVKKLISLHRYRFALRIVAYPRNASELLDDEVAFEYFYLQSRNDVLRGFLFDEVSDHRLIFQLAALQIWMFALRSNIDLSAKDGLKAIERQCSFTNFLPQIHSLSVDRTNRRTLAKYVRPKFVLQLFHSFSAFPPTVHSESKSTSEAKSHKTLFTERQLQLTYLNIISAQPAYGSKSFAAMSVDSSCSIRLNVSPNSGVTIYNTSSNVHIPTRMIYFNDIHHLSLKSESEARYSVEIILIWPESPNTILAFSMTMLDAYAFCSVISNYHKLQSTSSFGDSQFRNFGSPEDVLDNFVRQVSRASADKSNRPPGYFECHRVVASPWSYISEVRQTHVAYFIKLPAYEPRSVRPPELPDEYNCSHSASLKRPVSIHLCNEKGEQTIILDKECEPTNGKNNQDLFLLKNSCSKSMESKQPKSLITTPSHRPQLLDLNLGSSSPYRLGKLVIIHSTPDINRITPSSGFSEPNSVSTGSSPIPSTSVSPDQKIITRLPSFRSERYIDRHDSVLPPISTCMNHQNASRSKFLSSSSLRQRFLSPPMRPEISGFTGPFPEDPKMRHSNDSISYSAVENDEPSDVESAIDKVSTKVPKSASFDCLLIRRNLNNDCSQVRGPSTEHKGREEKSAAAEFYFENAYNSDSTSQSPAVDSEVTSAYNRYDTQATNAIGIYQASVGDDFNSNRIEELLRKLRERSAYDIDTVNVEAIEDLANLKTVTDMLRQQSKDKLTQFASGHSLSCLSLSSLSVPSNNDGLVAFLNSILKLATDISLESRLFISCSLRFELDSTVTFSVTLVQQFTKVLSSFHDFMSQYCADASYSNEYCSAQCSSSVIHDLLISFYDVLQVFEECYKFCLQVVIDNQRASVRFVNECTAKWASSLSKFVNQVLMQCDPAQKSKNNCEGNFGLPRRAVSRLGSSRLRQLPEHQGEQRFFEENLS